MRRSVKAIIACVGLVAVAGCGAGSDPSDVAEAFWSALEAGDWEDAREVSTAASERRLRSLTQEEPIDDVEIGAALTRDDTALVETSIARAHGQGDDPNPAEPVTFHTHLRRFDDGWRVDVDATLQEWRRAQLMSSLEGAGDALREGARVMGEALEEGLEEAGEAIREALEGLELSPPDSRAPGGAPPSDSDSL